MHMISALKSIKIGVFLSLVNLLIQGTAFLVQNGIAKNLGNAEYGYFGILQNDFLIFNALSDFGMSTLILAFFGAKATQGRLRDSILQLRFFASFLTMLLMLLFAFCVRRHHPAFYAELILAPGLILQHAFFDWYFTCGSFWKKLLIAKILHTVSYASVMAFALLYLKTTQIEIVALFMVLAAIPAWAFGVWNALRKRLLLFTKQTFRFIRLMYRAAIPYAIASLASFAYLPIGLYFIDHVAQPEFLSAYNYSHKLILLASGFMVHFISSSIISLHQSNDGKIHFKDQILFFAFIAICTSPLFLLPSQVLQILFFAAPWNDSVLAVSKTALRILSISLLLQALRMPYIASLLKEKQVGKYAVLLSIGGAFNILCCLFGIPMILPNLQYAACFVLGGDFMLTLLLFINAVISKKQTW